MFLEQFVMCAGIKKSYRDMKYRPLVSDREANDNYEATTW
jgi:hypothetical protein